MEGLKNKIVWVIIFAILVAMTIYTIVSMNSSFTGAGFVDYFKQAHIAWMFAAVVCMLAYILLEGISIRYITNFFYDGKVTMSKGFLYSAANIYFSAITPSATGGQPASAYFMIRDGIPASITAMALLINITLYTVSIVLIGLFSLVLSPVTFAGFDSFSKLLISLGFVIQIICITFFAFLVYKDKLTLGIATYILKILKKLHLIKHVEKKQKKLEQQAIEYKKCADALKGHKIVLFNVLLLTVIQRLAQIGATVCVYMSEGGEICNAAKVIATQGFVILGSNAVPIPGGVGVADYLFFDGFRHLVSKNIVELELLSRGISFYSCIIICVTIVVISLITNRIKKRKV